MAYTQYEETRRDLLRESAGETHALIPYAMFLSYGVTGTEHKSERRKMAKGAGQV